MTPEQRAAVARAKDAPVASYGAVVSPHDLRTLLALVEAGERMREANEALGSWMSAAMDDPSVCDAMKADIRRWFEAQALKEPT